MLLLFCFIYFMAFIVKRKFLSLIFSFFLVTAIVALYKPRFVSATYIA